MVKYRGVATTYDVSKMRAMTISCLCIHLGIRYETLLNYRKRIGFEHVTDKVDSIIYVQKFTGAAAGMLNPVIIARDLTLRANNRAKVLLGSLRERVFGEVPVRRSKILFMS